MIKQMIYGMGTEEDFNWVIVEKNARFLAWLQTFLKNSIGIDAPYLSEEYHHKKGKYKITYANIDKLTDTYAHCKSENAKVDIFYGKNKVFLVIRCPLTLRKKFTAELSKSTKWVKRR